MTLSWPMIGKEHSQLKIFKKIMHGVSFMLELHVLNFEGSGTAYVPGPTPEDVLQSGAVAASTRGALSYIIPPEQGESSKWMVLW